MKHALVFIPAVIFLIALITVWILTPTDKELIESALNKGQESAFNKRQIRNHVTGMTIKGHSVFVVYQDFSLDNIAGVVHLEMECVKCNE